MADIEQRLRELEETLSNTESALQREKANMPNDDDRGAGAKTGATCFPYVYIIGGLIPLITAAALFFTKPKWITKKKKGKQTVCVQTLLLWTAIITAIAWVGLYLMNYCGVFKGAALCFGGK